MIKQKFRWCLICVLEQALVASRIFNFHPINNLVQSLQMSDYFMLSPGITSASIVVPVAPPFTRLSLSTVVLDYDPHTTPYICISYGDGTHRQCRWKGNSTWLELSLNFSSNFNSGSVATPTAMMVEVGRTRNSGFAITTARFYSFSLSNRGSCAGWFDYFVGV